MSRQGWLVAAVVAGLGLLLAAGWMTRESFLPVEVGTSAPALVATDLAGRPVALADLRGDVVLLNVWATWCPPCIEEMPSMERLHRKVADEDFHIVAVSVDAPPGAARPGKPPGGNVAAFADSLGLTFDIWLDPEGEVERDYRTIGVPESFLIDRSGTIIKKVIGATDWDSEANVQLVRRLLER